MRPAEDAEEAVADRPMTLPGSSLAHQAEEGTAVAHSAAQQTAAAVAAAAAGQSLVEEVVGPSHHNRLATGCSPEACRAVREVVGSQNGRTAHNHGNHTALGAAGSFHKAARMPGAACVARAGPVVAGECRVCQPLSGWQRSGLHASVGERARFSLLLVLPHAEAPLVAWAAQLRA